MKAADGGKLFAPPATVTACSAQRKAAAVGAYSYETPFFQGFIEDAGREVVLLNVFCLVRDQLSLLSVSGEIKVNLAG